MNCDFLYAKDTYGVYDPHPRKASKKDIDNSNTARCGQDTEADYRDFYIDGVNYLIDLCEKHKDCKLNKEMVLKNDELLTQGRNFD